MDKSEHWKHLLHRLNCLNEGQITNPPGFNLTLEFSESASAFNYSSSKLKDQVDLFIDGIFFRIESASTHTYIPIDKLLNVMLTAVQK